jgi:hypothetical protein
MVTLIDSAKSSFLNEKPRNANSKEVFQILNGLLNIKVPDIAQNQNTGNLCETLTTFFLEKIGKIQADLDAAAPALSGPTTTAADAAAAEPASVTTLTSFTPITDENLTQILSSITKTCPLDSIPIFLFKEPSVQRELMPKTLTKKF